MSNTEVGVLIDANQKRDAIHIAVAPVRAVEALLPGTPIFFVDGSTIDVIAVPRPVSVGIVDPFLTVPVKSGQWFWMWLHPNTITSLRHDWTHPAFKEEMADAEKLKLSEQWLRVFCSQCDCPYDGLIEAAKSGGRWSDGAGYHSISINDGYISVQGSDAGGDIPDEFWEHLEAVTGYKPGANKPEYFSCSC